MGRHLYIDPMKCTGCTICGLVCSFLNEGVISPDKARLRFDRKRDGRDILISCQHCQKPMCMDACKLGAIVKENGIVKIVEKKCNACLKCVGACPLGMIIWHHDFKKPKKCNLCGRCAEFCPIGELKIRG